MPKHRGAHPSDQKIFTKERVVDLRSALFDLSWLLSRGYAETSSLKLVGDRYVLPKRARDALRRASCSDAQLETRKQRRLVKEDLHGASLLVDGFNILITLESALSAAPIFICRDGVYRDLASVHGSYKRVAETTNALDLIARFCRQYDIAKLHFFFDRPVSNSGRMSAFFREYAKANHLNWQVDVDDNPDRVLIESKQSVASADAYVIENANAYIDLAAESLKLDGRDLWTIDLHN